MKVKDAIDTVKYRIQYCANLYGAKWKEEEPFLKACQKALEEKKYYRERSPRERRPDDDTVVLAQVKITSGDTESEDMETEQIVTAFALFDPDEGWKLVERDDEYFEILSWRYMPEWTEKRKEEHDK